MSNKQRKKNLEAQVKGWQKTYEIAKRNGNKEGMEKAHREANALRTKINNMQTKEQAEAELNGWGRTYNAAKRNGDTVGMQKAHAAANKIRTEQGWQYDEDTGKTTERVFGGLKRTVNSRAVMKDAKIRNPNDVKPIKPSSIPNFGFKNANSPLEEIALGLGYGTEKLAAGAVGALEDAYRFTSGYGNKLLSGVTSLGGIAKNPLSDFLEQTAEKTLSDSYTDNWRRSIDDRYNPTDSQQKIGGLSEAAGAMLPSIAASMFTGGLSNAAALGKGASMTAPAAKAAQDISRGLGLATMFPSVAGQSTRQAMQEGADLNSALTYGALSGALETGTETLFSGIPGMKGGVVSDIIEKASRNPIVNRAADMLGEGVEEVISGVVSPYLQRLTYNEQAELASSDELLDSFLSGVALSGTMQGGANIAGKIANRSVGQSVDLNALGDNSRKNYIAQAEKDGGKTRGFDEQWKYYNDAGNTGIQFEQIPGDPKRIGLPRAYAAYAAGLNDYNARQSLTEQAQAEETQYNEPQSTGNVSAATYTPGLVQNDYTASLDERTANSIDTIAKKVGATVEITDNVSTAGEYRDGVIRINANSNNPTQQIFVHELTHHLEQSKEYGALSNIIERNLRLDGIDSKALKDRIKSEYSERGIQLDDDGASRELVAKYAESYLFTDETSIQRLAGQNRGLVQRIKDWIHGMVVKFKGTPQEKNLLETEKLYSKVLNNTNGTTRNQVAETMQADVVPDTEEPTIEQQYSSGSSFDQLLRDSGYDKEANQLKKAIKKYGEIPRGEMAARNVSIPTKRTEDTNVRRFARTVAESSILTDEQAGEIGKAVADGKFDYEPIQNEAARKHAEEVLTRGDGYAQDAWNRVINNNKPATKNDIAVGEYLLKQAAEAGDTQRVIELSAQIAAEGTRAGQIVQAMSMLKRLDGAGQSVALDAMLKKMQGDLDRGKSGVFLKVPDNLRENLLKAKGQEQVDAAMNEIYQSLADQLPTKWADKWNAWRYLSMLGNPRTHIRNIAGNAFFAPAVGTKNIIGSVIEAGTDAVLRLTGKNGIERTKTIRGTIPLTGGKIRTFAIDDFANVQDIIKGGGKMNPSDIIREKQTVFKIKPLESLRKMNFNALEAEDGIFLKHNYVRSLTQYLQVNKVNMDSFNPENSKSDSLLLKKAREYAINEAQKATYRDFSRVAQAISSASRNAGSAANILIEGVLPFKKTPINVLKRGIEYSPVGLLESLTIGTNKLAKGEINANEFIDKISAGLTGTGISLIGMLLYQSGLLVGGSGNDKDERFKDSLGAQSYAITIGNKSYTIDWLAPSSMPLFVGAEIQKIADDFDGINGRVIYDSLMNIAEPMTKMSMLDGINNSISSVRYGENPLSDLAANAVISYVGQAVPTLFGQIARTVDDTARTTYVDKNGSLPDSFQRALQKNQNKIPVLSKKSIAYRDVFGRIEKDESLLSRAVKNFISPGFFSEEKIGSMESELIRLYQSTGDGGTIPSKAAKYFNVGSERKDLTAEEYEKFTYSRGSVMYSALSELTQSTGYNKLDDSDRARAVSDVIQLSNSIAKTTVSDYELDGWMSDAVAATEVGISLSNYCLIRSQVTNMKGYKDKNGKTVKDSTGIVKANYILTETELTPNQRDFMYESLSIGKNVRQSSPQKIKSDYQKMKKEYGE